jgi:hypothetical protein
VASSIGRGSQGFCSKSFSANASNQRLATKGLSTPTDFIASPLHCLVRRCGHIRL